jgi:hypothetical protein
MARDLVGALFYFEVLLLRTAAPLLGLPVPILSVGMYAFFYEYCLL